ncbi:MAG: hypothetical protein WCB68_05075, partial [Pyrinomonadaceae bacterium]
MPSVSRGRRRAGFRFQGTSLTARFQTNLYAQHGLRASSAGGSPHVSYLIESEVGRFVNKEKGIKVIRSKTAAPMGGCGLPAQRPCAPHSLSPSTIQACSQPGAHLPVA